MAKKKEIEVEETQPEIETAPTAELPAAASAPELAAPTPAAGAFGRVIGGAKVKTAMKAYARLREQLKDEGDFPEWNDLGERAKNLYLDAVEHCLGDGASPRTLFEQIVFEQMA